MLMGGCEAAAQAEAEDCCWGCKLGKAGMPTSGVIERDVGCGCNAGSDEIVWWNVGPLLCADDEDHEKDGGFGVSLSPSDKAPAKTSFFPAFLFPSTSFSKSSSGPFT